MDRPILLALLVLWTGSAHAQDAVSPQAATIAPADASTTPAIDLAPLPEPGRRITLQVAMRIAREGSSDLRLAALSIERSRAAERIALAGLLPNLSASFSYTHWDQAVERMGLVIRQQDTFAGAIVANENLSLQRWNATRIADANTRVSSAQEREAQRLAMASVARAFFGELAAERNAVLARSQLAAAERQHRAVVARVTAGVALSIDSARSELAMLDAARRVADIDASLGRARDLLGLALGLDEAVAAEQSEIAIDGTLEAHLSSALRTRPDIRAARASLEAAELGVEDAWFRFVPTLGLSFTLNWTPQTTAFNPNPTQWLGVATLTLPIFDGGARYGALDDAEAVVAQARERIRALERVVRADVRDAHRRVEAASRSFEFAERSVAVARLAAERAEAAYNSGALTGLELDDARRAVEQAELTAILRALDRELAMVDLLSFVGEL